MTEREYVLEQSHRVACDADMSAHPICNIVSLHLSGEPHRAGIPRIGTAEWTHGKGVHGLQAMRRLLVQRHGLQALLQGLSISLLPLLLRLRDKHELGHQESCLPMLC